jgi:hypothetical protein
MATIFPPMAMVLSAIGVCELNHHTTQLPPHSPQKAMGNILFWLFSIVIKKLKKISYNKA